MYSKRLLDDGYSYCAKHDQHYRQYCSGCVLGTYETPPGGRSGLAPGYVWFAVDTLPPPVGQKCIVSAGPGNVAQHVPLVWDGKEFHWVEDMEEYFDPFPSEEAGMWMPWPEDPKST